MTKGFLIIQLEGCPHCESSITLLQQLKDKYGFSYKTLTITQAEKAVKGPLIKQATKWLRSELVTYPQTYIMSMDFADYLITTDLADLDQEKVRREARHCVCVGGNDDLQKLLLEEGFID